MYLTKKISQNQLKIMKVNLAGDIKYLNEHWNLLIIFYQSFPYQPSTILSNNGDKGKEKMLKVSSKVKVCLYDQILYWCR